MHLEGQSALAAAAFGDGAIGPTLPVPSTAAESWWRAVALGGAGYYARARTELTRTRRMATGAPASTALVSLTLSTQASWLRQLGWHRRAAELDGAALACAAPVNPDAPGRNDALCDALIGLAADALGQGRLALGAQLLDRCRTVIADPQGEVTSARIPVRLAWVAAELAMAGGQGEQALRAADQAVALAADGASVRHRVKSALLAAAARCAQGDVDAARVRAEAVRAQCRDRGLVPLGWAAAMLLAAVVDDADRTRVTADVASCAAELARRGGGLRVM